MFLSTYRVSFPILGSSVQEGYCQVGTSPGLGRMCFVNPKWRQQRGDRIAVFNYLTAGQRKDEARIFLEVHNDRLEATYTRGKIVNPREIKGKIKIPYRDDYPLKHVAQKVWGIFTLGSSHNSTRPGPE